MCNSFWSNLESVGVSLSQPHIINEVYEKGKKCMDLGGLLNYDYHGFIIEVGGKTHPHGYVLEKWSQPLSTSRWQIPKHECVDIWTNAIRVVSRSSQVTLINVYGNHGVEKVFLYTIHTAKRLTKPIALNFLR